VESNVDGLGAQDGHLFEVGLFERGGRHGVSTWRWFFWPGRRSCS
jgi:hypothetical protein